MVSSPRGGLNLSLVWLAELQIFFRHQIDLEHSLYASYLPRLNLSDKIFPRLSPPPPPCASLPRNTPSSNDLPPSFPSIPHPLFPPSLSLSMKLTFFTSSGESFFLELPSDMSIQDVKLLLEGDVRPLPPSPSSTTTLPHPSFLSFSRSNSPTRALDLTQLSHLGLTTVKRSCWRSDLDCRRERGRRE